jgi:hypothetical protein
MAPESADSGAAFFMLTEHAENGVMKIAKYVREMYL